MQLHASYAKACIFSSPYEVNTHSSLLKYIPRGYIHVLSLNLNFVTFSKKKAYKVTIYNINKW